MQREDENTRQSRERLSCIFLKGTVNAQLTRGLWCTHFSLDDCRQNLIPTPLGRRDVCCRYFPAGNVLQLNVQDSCEGPFNYLPHKWQTLVIYRAYPSLPGDSPQLSVVSVGNDVRVGLFFPVFLFLPQFFFF